MKLKQAAHDIVRQNHKFVHEVAIEGSLFVRGESRHGWMVTLTYKSKTNEILQGVGAAYFNPADTAYSQRCGYDIARGRAELSLGVRLIDRDMEFDCDFPIKKAKAIILDAVHRLPGDVRWKTLKSKKPRKSTSSKSPTPNMPSPKILGGVPVDKQDAWVTPTFAKFCLIGSAQNVPSAALTLGQVGGGHAPKTNPTTSYGKLKP